MSAAGSQTSARALAHASALCDLRRFEEAGSTVATVIAREPENERAWCVLANAMLGTGDVQGALRAARTAASLAPESEWPPRLASVALQRLRRDNEAVAAAQLAVRLAPHSWVGYIRLAEALLGEDVQLADAKMAADKALELAPQAPDSHRVAGAVFAAAGRPDEAAAAFRRALAIDPQNIASQNELARLQLRKRTPQALADAAAGFANAIATDPRASLSRRNLDVTLRRFMGWIAYLVLLDALVLARSTARSGEILLRLGPVVILALPAIYATRFVARLPDHLRAYLTRLVRQAGKIRTAVLLEMVAVAALVTGAAVPPSGRAVMAGVAVASGLLARVVLWTATSEPAVRRPRPDLKSGPSTTRGLSLLAVVLAIASLVSIGNALTTNARVLNAVWAAIFGVPCASVVRAIKRRRSRDPPPDPLGDGT